MKNFTVVNKKNNVPYGTYQSYEEASERIFFLVTNLDGHSILDFDDLTIIQTETSPMRIIESMTRITLPNKTYIRVWRQEFELKDSYDNDDLSVVANLSIHLTPSKIAEKICELPRINAVEVLGADGAGVLIYPDWP